MIPYLSIKILNFTIKCKIKLQIKYMLEANFRLFYNIRGE